MSKKAITTMNVVVIVVWLITIIVNLLSDDISKFSYGACGFTLLFSWVFKTISDIRVYDLQKQNSELFHRHIDFLTKLTKKEEDE